MQTSKEVRSELIDFAGASPRVIAVCKRLGVHYNDYEDIRQETAIRILTLCDKKAINRTNLAAFVARVEVNVIREDRRRNRRNPSIQVDQELEPLVLDDPSNELEVKELRELVLEALSPNERTLVSMLSRDEPTEKIAANLETSTNSTYQRKSRLLRKVESILKKQNE